jgi:CxxC-x17-CxxC domain-containing protein
MLALEIVCSICGQGFSFSPEEQAFYAEKGLSHPKKCKPCRNQARATGASRQQLFLGSQPRHLFDAVCASCQAPTQVPFKPNGKKPIYCRTCMEQY